ncbi:MAG: AraC family transcriptional regulator [Oscillospiraceae bacterium]|nr:AraC family transcriptional regulator [Oscillospiraceae bacterium]
MGISFRCEDYMYSYAAVKPPRLATHSHSYYEYLLFLSGDATYIVENSTYKANRGDIFITRPGELHTVSFNTDEPYERHFIQVNRKWIEKLPYDLLSFTDCFGPGENNRIPAWLSAEYGLEEFYKNIYYYMENELPESQFMVRTYIMQFMTKVNAILQRESINEEGDNKSVAKIKDYINRNFVNGISLDDLAKRFYMNKYYMCHMFKEETGLTIKEFVNTRRIAMAKQLLPKYKLVKDLYTACGFNDYSTFYKTFKRFTGVSPKEFLSL